MVRHRAPIVIAKRVPKRDNDLLRITCPFCGRRHTHGAVGKGSPIGAGDGHRAAHCVNPDNPGYYIIEERP